MKSAIVMQESLPQYREAGKLTATEARVKNGRPSMKPGVKSVVIDRNIPTPQPPFTGFRHVTAIDPAELFSYVNEQALFRGRWGYRRTASSSAEEYAELTRTTVRPIYEELKQRALQEGLLQPKAAYGYFRCYSEGDTVYVENGDETLAFDFPRQQSPPHLCIADYYRSREEGGGYRRFLRGDHRGEDRRRDQAPV